MCRRCSSMPSQTKSSLTNRGTPSRRDGRWSVVNSREEWGSERLVAVTKDLLALDAHADSPYNG